MDLQNISQKAGIKESDVIDILYMLHKEPSTTSDLAKRTNLTHGQIKRLSSFLGNLCYVKGGKWILTKEGEKALDSPKNGGGFDEGKLLDFVGEAKTLMPKPKRAYDQFYTTSETVVKRVKLLVESGDLAGRSILFLGDDDLTSLAAGFVGTAKEISALEIDEDIIDLIKNISNKQSLGIKTQVWDLKMGLPKDYFNKYDTVFTDPPYTEAGFDTFLRRSLEATKNQLSSSHYICYGTSSLSREKFLKIQKIIDKYSLFIKGKYSNFNKYISGAESIGNTSDLYVLEKTPQTRLGKARKVQKLYTWEQ